MTIIYKGLFLTKESENVLFQRRNLLSYKVENLHITFEFKPSKPFPSEILGGKYKVKVVGEGRDDLNHGYLVELPDELKEYYSGAKNIHITVSMKSKKTKAVRTNKLSFKPIEPFEIEGVLGHYTSANRITYGNKNKKEIADKKYEEKRKQSNEKKTAVLKKEITEKINQLNKNKFIFKNGFDRIEQLVKSGEKIGLTKSRYYILAFRGKFFGICFSDWNKQVLLTKDRVYARKAGGLFSEFTYENCKLPYSYYSRSSISCEDSLAREIISYDNNLSIGYYKNVNSEDLIVLNNPLDAHNYLIVFGAVCFNYFYTVEEFDSLKKYFRKPANYKSLFKQNVVAINPFKQQVMLPSGAIKNFVYDFDFYHRRGNYIILHR